MMEPTERIAWKCDQCGQAAVVVIDEGAWTLEDLNAAALASHARCSPECGAETLTVYHPCANAFRSV
jgi:hypothetical protein